MNDHHTGKQTNVKTIEQHLRTAILNMKMEKAMPKVFTGFHGQRMKLFSHYPSRICTQKKYICYHLKTVHSDAAEFESSITSIKRNRKTKPSKMNLQNSILGWLLAMYEENGFPNFSIKYIRMKSNQNSVIQIKFMLTWMMQMDMTYLINHIFNFFLPH